MGRIAARFAALKAQGRGALIPFVEAWDPDGPTSMALLRGMPGAGADLIEIGIPFTDPMADGPIIQAAARRALLAGVKLRFVLDMVREFRTEDADTPIILMGYLNPILSYGVRKFCEDAADAGVDGFIIVDLPTEESDLMLPHTNANGLDFIRLIAPTTDDARLPHVLNGSSGFVYYIGITGITGTRGASSADLAVAIPRVRKATDLPIAVGFGVRTPAQAGEASRVANAAVVASALIETMANNLDTDGKAKPGTVEKILAQVKALADGVRGQGATA
ncbi:MAG: tryptophan synthase subunit alpha [Rhodospirillales bacterium]